MTVKRPVSGSLARAFFSMIVLSVLISAIALVTLASSQRDAEAINIAGSLRMQSYRLGYEMQRASPSLAGHRAVWQKTLSAPALQKLNRWYVPEDVKQRIMPSRGASNSASSSPARWRSCGVTERHAAGCFSTNPLPRWISTTSSICCAC